MMVTYTCPSCGKDFSVPEWLKQEIKCPRCGTTAQELVPAGQQVDSGAGGIGGDGQQMSSAGAARMTGNASVDKSGGTTRPRSGIAGKKAPPAGARFWPKVSLGKWVLGGNQLVRFGLSGAKLLATNEMTAAGVDFLSAGIATGCTLVIYLVANFCLGLWIDRSYDEFRPEQFAGVDDLEKAWPAIIGRWPQHDDDESMAKLKSFVVANNETFRRPFHVWLEDIFLDPGSKADAKRTLTARLRSLATGDRKGWVVMSAQSATGNQVYEKLLKADDTGYLESLGGNAFHKEGKQGAETRDAGVRLKLFVAMCNELLTSTQEPIRWLLRLNGWIQFLTILLAIFVLVAIIRRYLFISRLASRWLDWKAGSAPIPLTEQHSADQELWAIASRLNSTVGGSEADIIRSELDRIRAESDRSVYDSYWFLAGILPSLGFIGTVVGMSSALLKADRLFAATDQQLAIGDMTKELGVAFDTTLVALLMGLIVTIPLATVRAREFTFYREFARRVLMSKAADSTNG
jgi:biopolymer transport protein ExbB/TolQ